MGAQLARFWHLLASTGRQSARRRRSRPYVISGSLLLGLLIAWLYRRRKAKRRQWREMTMGLRGHRTMSQNIIRAGSLSGTTGAGRSDATTEVDIDLDSETSGETVEEDDTEVFASTKLFTALDRFAWDELRSLMQRITLAEDEKLFNQGDQSNLGTYVILHGTVEVFMARAGEPDCIMYELTSGDDLCVASLFSDAGQGQKLSARAVRGPVECLLLPRLQFKEFANSHAVQFDGLIRIIVGRNWRLVTQVLTSFLHLPAMTTQETQGGEDCAHVDITEAMLDAVLSGSGWNYELNIMEPGDVLFEMGDGVECCYVLVSGELVGTPTSAAMIHTIQWSHVISPQSVVGVMSFITGSKRGETVHAIAQSKVICISKELYKFLLFEHPECALPLLWAAGKQLSALTMRFFSLGLYSIWHRGGTIIQESQTQVSSNPAMFLVISGRVRVMHLQQENRSQRELGHLRKRFFETTLSLNKESVDTYEDLKQDLDENATTISVGRGETFGESRTFSEGNSLMNAIQAICERDTELVVITKQSLRNIMLRYPETISRFTEMMSKRLAYLENDSVNRRQARLQRNLKTITLVPAGSTPPQEMAAFALRLAASLSDLDSTLLLNSQRLPHLVGRDILRQLKHPTEMSRLSLWLAMQEELNRFIILETDGGPNITAWDSFCIRQSDCVVLVGRSGSLPSPNNYEQRLLAYAARRRRTTVTNDWQSPLAQSTVFSLHCVLLLIHPDWTDIPIHTSQWLHARTVKSWHHIRVSYKTDYGRFARYLSGESIGLVLGGGGCRGLAHLGVMRALSEEGISVDCIGGTSQGAFMGGLYSSCNQDLVKMEVLVRKFAYRFNRFEIGTSFTLPILSFFNGYSFSDGVKQCLGADSQIEDLWIPFFAITTNVGRSNSTSHMTGSLWKLVRASMSLMGLLPPVIHCGDVLVDGGYSNNLPVDVMNKQFCPNTVICVDVEDRNNESLINLYDYGEGISGWWILYQKLNPFHRHKVPQFYDILIWLNCINHSRQLRSLDRECIDVYVRPNIQNFGLLEYHKIDQIVQAGYDAAKLSLARWRMEKAERESWKTFLQAPSSAGPKLINKSTSMREMPARTSRTAFNSPLVRVGSVPDAVVGSGIGGFVGRAMVMDAFAAAEASDTAARRPRSVKPSVTFK